MKNRISFNLLCRNPDQAWRIFPFVLNGINQRLNSVNGDFVCRQTNVGDGWTQRAVDRIAVITDQRNVLTDSAAHMMNGVNARNGQTIAWQHQRRQIGMLLQKADHFFFGHQRPVSVIVKFKQQLFATAQLSQAEVLYREGEHIQALRQAAGIKCTTKRQLLDTALLAAKCHISLEEPEMAREKLNYIVEHGNKLHIVEEAKVLLETLN